MVLRGLEDAELPSTQAGVDALRLADLILLVEEVGGDERAFVIEAFRLAAGGLALPTPTEHALAAHAEALEKDVAVLVGKVIVARLLQREGAEVHVPPVVEVEELERVDERGLARVVRADNLERAVEFHFGVVITPRADEDELLGAIRHDYSCVAGDMARLRRPVSDE